MVGMYIMSELCALYCINERLGWCNVHCLCVCPCLQEISNELIEGPTPTPNQTHRFRTTTRTRTGSSSNSSSGSDSGSLWHTNTLSLSLNRKVLAIKIIESIVRDVARGFAGPARVDSLWFLHSRTFTPEIKVVRTTNNYHTPHATRTMLGTWRDKTLFVGCDRCRDGDPRLCSTLPCSTCVELGGHGVYLESCFFYKSGVFTPKDVEVCLSGCFPDPLHYRICLHVRYPGYHISLLEQLYRAVC